MDLPERRRSPSAATAPLRTLVVDDDPNYRTYISLLARRLGYQVDTTPDGRAALDRLILSPYDIVVIDLEMPRMNGMELIARIRNEPSLRSIYALMLTATEDTHTKLEALNGGFDDFVTKSESELEIVAKLVAARRIAERQRLLHGAIDELYRLATRDDLTTVFNRRFFVSETERLLEHGMPLGIVLFDLNQFKEVNDTYGHLTGDRVLRDVGAVFQRFTRAIDLIARYGGDEFVMTVAESTQEETITIAERMVALISALTWTVAERTFSVSATTGISFSELRPGATLAQLLNVADRDLYKNKWLRNNPDARPELYEYPEQKGELDVLTGLPDSIPTATPKAKR